MAATPKPEREPITLRALATVVVGAVAQLVMAFGIEVSQTVQHGVIGVVLAGGLVYTVATGRRKVTVLVDPKDTDGTPLVRADTATAADQTKRAE